MTAEDAVTFLRTTIKEQILELIYGAEPCEPECHCQVCIFEHALAVTSGWEEK